MKNYKYKGNLKMKIIAFIILAIMILNAFWINDKVEASSGLTRSNGEAITSIATGLSTKTVIGGDYSAESIAVLPGKVRLYNYRDTSTYKDQVITLYQNGSDTKVAGETMKTDGSTAYYFYKQFDNDTYGRIYYSIPVKEDIREVATIVYKEALKYHDETYDLQIDIDEIRCENYNHLVAPPKVNFLKGSMHIADQNSKTKWSSYTDKVYPQIGVEFEQNGSEDINVQVKATYYAVDSQGNRIKFAGVAKLTDIDLNEGWYINNFEASNNNTFYNGTDSNHNEALDKVKAKTLDGGTYFYSSTPYDTNGADINLLLSNNADNSGFIRTFQHKSAYSSFRFGKDDTYIVNAYKIHAKVNYGSKLVGTSDSTSFSTININNSNDLKEKEYTGIKENSDFTVEFAPLNDNYELTDVKVNGNSINLSGQTSYKFENITRDSEIEVTYNEKKPEDAWAALYVRYQNAGGRQSGSYTIIPIGKIKKEVGDSVNISEFGSTYTNCMQKYAAERIFNQSESVTSIDELTAENTVDNPARIIVVFDCPAYKYHFYKQDTENSTNYTEVTSSIDSSYSSFNYGLIGEEVEIPEVEIDGFKLNESVSGTKLKGKLGRNNTASTPLELKAFYDKIVAGYEFRVYVQDEYGQYPIEKYATILASGTGTDGELINILDNNTVSGRLTGYQSQYYEDTSEQYKRKTSGNIKEGEILKLDIHFKRPVYEVHYFVQKQAGKSDSREDYQEITSLKKGPLYDGNTVYPVKPDIDYIFSKGLYKEDSLKVNEEFTDFASNLTTANTESNPLVLRVYYDLVETQEETHDITYTVEYYKHELGYENSTKAVDIDAQTRSIPVSEDTYTLTTQDKANINTKNRFPGYKLEVILDKGHNVMSSIPNTVKDGDIIRIIYKEDETQEQENEYEYCIKYYYNGKEDENARVTGKAAKNEVIENYTDKNKTGYKFKEVKNKPLTITENEDNNVMEVYYITDEDQKKELKYTVQYYKNGNKDELIERKQTVQVLEDDNITVNTEDINLTNKYGEEWTCTGTNPSPIPDKVASGTQIAIYYTEKESQTPTTTVKYTVTFDGDNGTEVVEKTVEENKTVTEPDDPQKAGYTFDGWYDKETDQKFDFDTQINKDYNLIAKWIPIQYTITYVLDGGTNSSDNPSKYSTGEVVTFKNPTKNNYEFLGWYEDEEFKTPITQLADRTGDITIYAKWKILENADNDKIAYTVHYYFEQANGNYIENIGLKQTKYAEENETVSAEIKTFVGFQENKNHSDRLVNGKVTKDGLDLKVYYSLKKYTVTFTTNNGTTIKDQIINHNEKVTEPSKLNKDGYEFKYWYYLNDDEKEIVYNFDTEVTKDYDLIAKWEKTKENNTSKNDDSQSGTSNKDTTKNETSGSTTVEKTQTSKNEGTVANKILPKTGNFEIVIVLILLVLIFIGIKTGRKYIDLKRHIK